MVGSEGWTQESRTPGNLKLLSEGAYKAAR